MIYTNSRYRSGRQFPTRKIRNGREQQIPCVYTREPVPLDSAVRVIHTVQAGDRIDMLAFKYAGNSRLWWVIADLNRIRAFPFQLAPGTELLIPTREVFRRVAG